MRAGVLILLTCYPSKLDFIRVMVRMCAWEMLPSKLSFLWTLILLVGILEPARSQNGKVVG